MPHIRKHLQRQEEVQQQQQSTSSSANEMLPEEVETEDEYAVQTLEESFVRRYSADTRPLNPFHRDRYRVTINVALSAHEDYGGGHLLGVFDGHIHRMDRLYASIASHCDRLIECANVYSALASSSSLALRSLRTSASRRHDDRELGGRGHLVARHSRVSPQSGRNAPFWTPHAIGGMGGGGGGGDGIS